MGKSLVQFLKKRTDDHPRLADSLYQALFLSANDPIVCFDGDGTIITANLAFYRAVNQAPGEVLSLKDVVAAPDQVNLGEVFRFVRAGKTVNRYRMNLIGPGLADVSVEGSIAVIPQHDGKNLGWGIFHDLAEQAAVERKLREVNSEHRQRRFELEALKSLSDRLTNVVDITEAVRSINAYLGDILEYDAAVFFILDPSETGGIIYQAYLRSPVGPAFLQGMAASVGEFVRRQDNGGLASAWSDARRDGPVILGGTQADEVRDKPGSALSLPLVLGGATLGVIHVAAKDKERYRTAQGWLTDAMVVTFILFLVRLQTLVRSQRSRTEALVQSLGDGVVMYNERGEVSLINPSALNALGLRESHCRLDDIESFIRRSSSVSWPTMPARPARSAIRTKRRSPAGCTNYSSSRSATPAGSIPAAP